MFYDFMKILKACLKRWYIFVLTLVLGLSSLFFVGPMVTYQKSFDLQTNIVDRTALMGDNNGLMLYDYFNNLVLSFVENNYISDNEERIYKELDVSKKDFKITLKFTDYGYYDLMNVNLTHSDEDKIPSIMEFIELDLFNYIAKIATAHVPATYLIPATYNIYNETSVDSSLNDNIYNVLLIVAGILLLEIVILGFITIRKNKICFDEEIQADYDGLILVKDYDKNVTQIQDVIKSMNKEKPTMVLCENIEYTQKCLADNKIECQEIKTICDFSQASNFKADNIVIEIVKGETCDRNIQNITKALSVTDKKVYYITRNIFKEKKDK